MRKKNLLTRIDPLTGSNLISDRARRAPPRSPQMTTTMFAKKNPIPPQMIAKKLTRIVDFPDRARRAVDPATFIEVTPDDREKFTKNLTE